MEKCGLNQEQFAEPKEIVWTKEYWDLCTSLCTLNSKIWKLAYSLGTFVGDRFFHEYFKNEVVILYLKEKTSSETHDFTSGNLKVSHSSKKQAQASLGKGSFQTVADYIAGVHRASAGQTLCDCVGPGGLI